MKPSVIVVALLAATSCQGMFHRTPSGDAGADVDADSDVDGDADAVVDPCDGVECSRHGVCFEQDGEAVCACHAGFHAEELECVPNVVDGDDDSDGAGDTGSDAEADPPVPDGWVVVPAGGFVMGSPEDEEGRDTDEVQHEVILTHGFEIQTTEVTQTQFMAVMGYNPSRFSGCPGCPVERVSWHEAAAYCNALSDAGGLPRCYECSGTGVPVQCAPSAAYPVPYDCPGYRLPTEAEFELAARAGTTGPSYGDLDAVAWHAGIAGGRTHEVGGLEPNAFGLYDVLGNVWEWCNDWYGAYPAGPVTDPTGPTTGALRVYRGGSWYLFSEYSRAASRNALAPVVRYGNIGLRPARTR